VVVTYPEGLLFADAAVRLELRFAPLSSISDGRGKCAHQKWSRCAETVAPLEPWTLGLPFLPAFREDGQASFAPKVGSVTTHPIIRYGTTVCAVVRARVLFQFAPRLRLPKLCSEGVMRFNWPGSSCLYSIRALAESGTVWPPGSCFRTVNAIVFMPNRAGRTRPRSRLPSGFCHTNRIELSEHAETLGNCAVFGKFHYNQPQWLSMRPRSRLDTMLKWDHLGLKLANNFSSGRAYEHYVCRCLGNNAVAKHTWRRR
jgi:hypothetical protein